MAIRLRERPDSRQLHYGASGGGETLKFNVITTAGEDRDTIWLYVLSQTEPFFDGFIRNDIKVIPVGGPLWTADVEYGTTGVGGGDEPLGGVGGEGGPPTPPSDPAGDTDPLPSSWTFSISAPRIHITQSLATVSSHLRGGGDAPDWKGKIGVGRDGKVEGCDVPPEPTFRFTRTWARADVTLAYFERLAALAGCVNSAEFLGFAVGEVLLLNVSGQGTEGDKWSITAEFGLSLNKTIDADYICEGLPDSSTTKQGWMYLWVYDVTTRDANNNDVVQPHAMYIERIFESADLNDIWAA